MILETLIVGPLETNCYILGAEDTGEAIVIDPGAGVPAIMGALEEKDLGVRYIFNTHGHFDHVSGDGGLKDATGAEIMLHPADAFLLEALEDQASAFGIAVHGTLKVDVPLADGFQLALGEVRGTVLHTPGHTPGSVCLLVGGKAFVGDTIFAGSVGRTDLPGGSYEEIAQSVRRLLALGDGVELYPGHGPKTTVGRERAHNPLVMEFLKEA